MLALRPYQQDALNALRTRLKETETPLLVNASVGAGKSLIIAELLLTIERAGWRALCLTMNSTLIKQNAETYKRQGGNPGVYCAALDKKDTDKLVLFASPQSVINGIKEETEIAHVPFNLLVIDECHNINIKYTKATYTKILNWYSLQSKVKDHKFRIVGLTGTPYRGKGISIIKSPTNDAGWMEEVCSIDASWLISQRYLTKPYWGKTHLEYDFDAIKTNSMGKFNPQEVKNAVCAKPRLTHDIMQEVQAIVSNRQGAFIFATSVEHCYECLASLPCNEAAVITGGTPDDLRQKYIESARYGEIKYLINVNVLCTGVDVPIFDTVVFVRPTESLVLYVQALGRGLRLSQEKKDCLILDYAGNLERHGDIDNPIINQAIKQQSRDDPEYCIPCYECKTYNKVTARRCIGTIEEKRCDHYFEFKECLKCKTLNDITARFCRECKVEIVDPNKKLTKVAAAVPQVNLMVMDSEYWLTDGRLPIFCAKYIVHDGSGRRPFSIGESYSILSDKGRNIFYGKFVKDQFHRPYESYGALTNTDHLSAVIRYGQIKTPSAIIARQNPDGTLRIYKKIFN